MIEVDEALALVLERARSNPQANVEVTKAHGHALSKPIENQADTPAFDKALMDGYAVRACDVPAPATELPLARTITAGETMPPPLAAGTAVLIMTGAPLPAGADAVVMRELVHAEANRVVVQHPVVAEQNLMRAGQIRRAGETVLESGHRIGAAEVGVLIEAGFGQVPVVALPTVGILPTGNELAELGKPLQPGQIRNTNGPMLRCMASELPCTVDDLGIGRDDRTQLHALVEQGLRRNVLVLSGGVSAGDLDLVPQVLADCGVEQVFHKVRLKPGKPIWFGVAPSGALVFGLPGNPVSSFVCFRLFVEPAIQRLAGFNRTASATPTAMLITPFTQRGDRPTYFPSVVSRTAQGEQELRVLDWLGSSDLHTFTKANCLAVFPAGITDFGAGTAIGYKPLDTTD